MKPGACPMTVQMSREFGMSFNISCVMFVWTFVFLTSTTGEAPVTVTVSVTDATASCTGTLAVKPMVMMMPSRLTVPKPVNWYFRAYSPGGSDGKR